MRSYAPKVLWELGNIMASTHCCISDIAVSLLLIGSQQCLELSLNFLGFKFADLEPSALIQINGGPCAVIAPVQAYILKNLLFNEQGVSEDTSTIDLKTLSGRFC